MKFALNRKPTVLTPIDPPHSDERSSDLELSRRRLLKLSGASIVAIRQLRALILPISLCIVVLLPCRVLSAQNEEPRVRNIVLVHGAWADGSGWKGVYDLLGTEGYNVSIVQEPLTSFQEDVAATKRVLAQQEGRCILVGHSYGGIRHYGSGDGSIRCWFGVRGGPHARCWRE